MQLSHAFSTKSYLRNIHSRVSVKLNPLTDLRRTMQQSQFMMAEAKKRMFLDQKQKFIKLRQDRLLNCERKWHPTLQSVLKAKEKDRQQIDLEFSKQMNFLHQMELSFNNANKQFQINGRATSRSVPSDQHLSDKKTFEMLKNPKNITLVEMLKRQDLDRQRALSNRERTRSCPFYNRPNDEEKSNDPQSGLQPPPQSKALSNQSPKTVINNQSTNIVKKEQMDEDETMEE